MLSAQHFAELGLDLEVVLHNWRYRLPRWDPRLWPITTDEIQCTPPRTRTEFRALGMSWAKRHLETHQHTKAQQLGMMRPSHGRPEAARELAPSIDAAEDGRKGGGQARAGSARSRAQAGHAARGRSRCCKMVPAEHDEHAPSRPRVGIKNVEPNTTENFNPNPATDAETLEAWRYAYNDAGDLIGTSDARGCGQNFFYDGTGTLTAEDYAPCESHHAAYSPANATTGVGVEVLYEYDGVRAGLLPTFTRPPGFVSDSPLLRGRLAAVFSRGSPP